MTSQGHPDDYVMAVKQSWLPVVIIAAVAWLISLGVTAITPPLYEARATILFAQQSGSADLAAALGTTQSPVGVLKGVVTSLRMQRVVSKRTGINIKDVEGVVQVRADTAANQLQIGGVHGRRDIALQVAGIVLEEMGRIQREVGLSVATRQVAAIDDAIRSREDERVKTLEKLVKFQESAKTITDPSKLGDATTYAKILNEIEFDLGSAEREIEAHDRGFERVIKNRASIQSWLNNNPLVEKTMTAELKFRALQRTLGPENPQLIAAERAYRSLEEALQKEITASLTSQAAGIQPEFAELVAKRDFLRWQRSRWKILADQAPQDAIDLARLTEELATKEQIIAALRRRREEAKLISEVDRFRWSILQKPELLSEPTNKNWFQNGMLGIVLGAIAGMGYVILRNSR